MAELRRNFTVEVERRKVVGVDDALDRAAKAIRARIADFEQAVQGEDITTQTYVRSLNSCLCWQVEGADTIEELQISKLLDDVQAVLSGICQRGDDDGLKLLCEAVPKLREVTSAFDCNSLARLTGGVKGLGICPDKLTVPDILHLLLRAGQNMLTLVFRVHQALTGSDKETQAFADAIGVPGDFGAADGASKLLKSLKFRFYGGNDGGRVRKVLSNGKRVEQLFRDISKDDVYAKYGLLARASFDFMMAMYYLLSVPDHLSLSVDCFAKEHPQRVSLYNRFGLAIRNVTTVLGEWYMLRNPSFAQLTNMGIALDKLDVDGVSPYSAACQVTEQAMHEQKAHARSANGDVGVGQVGGK